MIAKTSSAAHRGVSFVVCVPIAIFLAGCAGDEPERVVVEGSVTYLGRPIDIGGIQFVPIEGTPGVALLVEIADGRYVAAANGGVPLGKYRVEIQGFRRPGAVDSRGAGAAAPSEARGERFNPDGRNGSSLLPSEAPREQYIPEKFNLRTQLTTTIEASEGLLKRDFSLSD